MNRDKIGIITVTESHAKFVNNVQCHSEYKKMNIY